ncbi:Uncharacterised protein [Mycobacteroides abscessus subsp. abscessus]|nr:Uncharacterised protein [Mycobacteroides abscessus subsp. abscessus]
MSSTVMMPAIPPYSSITTAISSSEVVSRRSSTAGSGSVVGTIAAGRARSAAVRLVSSSRSSRSCRCTIPTTSSGFVPTTGYRVCPTAIRSRTSDSEVSAATKSTRGRGTIACSAVRVGKSRTRSRSVDSSAGNSPTSRDSATMCSRSRGDAECSTSCTGSMRSALSRRFDAASNSEMTGPNTLR